MYSGELSVFLTPYAYAADDKEYTALRHIEVNSSKVDRITYVSRSSEEWNCIV